MSRALSARLAATAAVMAMMPTRNGAGVESVPAPTSDSAVATAVPASGANAPFRKVKGLPEAGENANPANVADNLNGTPLVAGQRIRLVYPNGAFSVHLVKISTRPAVVMPPPDAPAGTQPVIGTDARAYVRTRIGGAKVRMYLRGTAIKARRE